MTRACGGCTLCCKLIPVEELGKPAGVRCEHVRTGHGCRIYAKRPWSGREWSCLWIKGTEDGGDLPLRRPDRAHYVLDETPDLVRLRNDDTGEIEQELTVMQVWVDPLFPDAWQDPALLDMLDRQGVVALIRYSRSDGFALFPPSRNSTGQWQRSPANMPSAAREFEEARLQARFDFWRAAQQGDENWRGHQQQPSSGSTPEPSSS